MEKPTKEHTKSEGNPQEVALSKAMAVERAFIAVPEYLAARTWSPI